MKLTLVITALAWALVAYGFVTLPERCAAAYLTAWLFWLTTALGSLFLVLVADAARVLWFVVLRRLAELVTAGLALLALAFVPIALTLGQLYPWAGARDPSRAPAHQLEHLHPYLSHLFFIGRAVVFLALWVALAEWLFRSSLAQDLRAKDEASLLIARRRVAGFGLPLFALTLTFAAFDWIMSLTPAWESTMFGVYVFAGTWVAGLATMIVLGRVTISRRVVTAIREPHFLSLGKLLFTSVVFWGYIGYAQFFLIRIADLPDEVPWYSARLGPVWLPLSIFLLVGHFALPFFVLLSRRLKLVPPQLALVAAWLLACHYFDVYWAVIPSRYPNGTTAQWLDAACVIALGGSVAAFATFRARKRSLVPVADPRLAAATRYLAS